LRSNQYCSGIFEKILCFSQQDFQPSATHKSFMDWALSPFVFDRPKVEHLLCEHQALGAHTDIVQFKSGDTKRFRWTHPGSRPLGYGINSQCQSCKRLKTNVPKPKADHSQIMIQCSQCKLETLFTLPPNWNWVNTPPLKGDERGAWLVQTEFDLMDMT
jgi:hypothetical protein